MARVWGLSAAIPARIEFRDLRERIRVTVARHAPHKGKAQMKIAHKVIATAVLTIALGGIAMTPAQAELPRRTAGVSADSTIDANSADRELPRRELPKRELPR